MNVTLETRCPHSNVPHNVPLIWRAGPGRPGYLCFSLLRYPPVSSSRTFIQNTGCMPAAVPREPNAIGTTIWVNLLTVRRSPSASPRAADVARNRGEDGGGRKLCVRNDSLWAPLRPADSTLASGGLPCKASFPELAHCRDRDCPCRGAGGTGRARRAGIGHPPSL